MDPQLDSNVFLTQVVWGTRMADSPASKVKFVDESKAKPTLVKHVPTQKYDRREIQKRLEIENWMDEKLKDLYDSEVSQ